MTMTDVADGERDRSNGGEVVKRTDDDLGRVGGRKRRLGKRSRSSRSSSSTSDDNMPVEKRYPCLLAQACDGGAVLYGFNVSDLNRRMNRRIFCRKCCAELSGGGEEEPPVLGMRDLTPANSECNPDLTMAVAVGSSVYILGGDFADEDCMQNLIVELSREVFKFDTNRPQEGWIQCPDMLNCRSSRSQAVAVEGKIYVFGGNDCEKEKDGAGHPWAEVFDPIKQEWEALPPPPKAAGIVGEELLGSAVAYGDPCDEKKIMLGRSKHVYHVNSKTWEDLSSRIWRNLGINLTAVGNFLYWTSQELIFACDMKTLEIDATHISGYRIHDEYDFEPNLLHLSGDKFCFLKLDNLPPGRAKFRLLELRVSLRRGAIKASVLSRETFVIDRPLDREHRAFVLEGDAAWVKSGRICP